MQHDTIPTSSDDRFATEPVGIDLLLKDVVDSLVNLWNCETRVLNLQAEFLERARLERAARRDRESLDLSA